MHKVSVPDINQAKYKARGPQNVILDTTYCSPLNPEKAEYQQDGWTWNTREIEFMFKSMREFYGVDNYLKAMGWTHEEYLFTIKWTEDLVRGY